MTLAAAAAARLESGRDRVEAAGGRGGSAGGIGLTEKLYEVRRSAEVAKTG